MSASAEFVPDPYLTQHEAAKPIGIRQRYLVRTVEIGEGLHIESDGV